MSVILRHLFDPLRHHELSQPIACIREIGVTGFSFQQYAALLNFQDAFVDLAPYGKRPGPV